MNDTELNILPLRKLHEEAGARFGAFAGWSMPITYPAGVMKEHVHTRESAGLFDISHMKLILVEGPDAARVLAAACPLEPEKLAASHSKYTLLLNDDAGILDDLIVTRLGEDRFMVVANAATAEQDAAIFAGFAKGRSCTVTPLDRVFLAVQGPQAIAILADAGLDLTGLTFMHGIEPKSGWFASRSGYTGEDGGEVALPPQEAEAFVRKLLADPRLAWTGLAARDSLRLEAGLCLYGHDMDETTDPVAAGLLWAIPKALRCGGPYRGATRLAELAAAQPSHKRVGLKPEGRQPVRDGAALFDETGKPAGIVTSGGFGPSVGHPVAMGRVRSDLAEEGTLLFAEVRGNKVPLRVHSLPFFPHRHHKG